MLDQRYGSCILCIISVYLFEPNLTRLQFLLHSAVGGFKHRFKSNIGLSSYQWGESHENEWVGRTIPTTY